MSEFRRPIEGSVAQEPQRIRVILPKINGSGDHKVLRGISYGYETDDQGFIRAVEISGPHLIGKRGRSTENGTRKVDLSWKGTGSVQLSHRWILDVEVEGGPIRPKRHRRSGRIVREGRNAHLFKQ